MKSNWYKSLETFLVELLSPLGEAAVFGVWVATQWLVDQLTARVHFHGIALALFEAMQIVMAVATTIVGVVKVAERFLRSHHITFKKGKRNSWRIKIKSIRVEAQGHEKHKGKYQ